MSHSAPRGQFRATAAFSLVVIALLGATPAAGVEAERLTLAAAVSRALQEGYAARIARLATGGARDAHLEMRGSYLPQLFVTSAAGWSNQRDEKLIALDKRGQFRSYDIASIGSSEGSFNVYIEQLLFDLKRWKLIEREEIAAEAAHVAELQERESVAYDVTRKFTQVVRLQRLADLAGQQVADARWLDDQARKLYEVGQLLQSELGLVTLHLDESEIAAQMRAAEADDARAALWLAIAAGEETEMPISVVAGSLPRLDAVPQEEDEALSSSPELRVLELRRRMEEANVSAASARRLPTVGVRAGYAYFGTDDRGDLYKDEVRVGLAIEVPIFDGFRARHGIAAARKKVEIARLRHRSLLDRKRLRVRELIRQLEMAGLRQGLAERREAAAREEQRLVDLRLKAGRERLKDVLDVREETARDAGEAADARFARIDLWAELQHQRGRLTDAILGASARSPSAP
jgi:cobalt-zinc-cadmium efflux system outer membrane protein